MQSRGCTLGYKLSDGVKSVILNSWRTKTKQQYKIYLDKWSNFCKREGLDPYNAQVERVLEFLYDLYQTNIGYSALNTARSALSTVLKSDGEPIGKHPLIIRFLRGVFNEKPALPRNKVIWDPVIVLNFFKEKSKDENLSIKELTLKLVTLAALVSGQRAQTLHLLNINSMQKCEKQITFFVEELVKTTRPGKHLEPILFKAYDVDSRICVFSVLNEYLHRTSVYRGNITQLFVTYRKPYKAVSKSTISRWIKSQLVQAGIDMKMFTPHSTRAASTSKVASLESVQLSTVLKTAGWSNAQTFAKYYNKPIVSESNFASELLKCASK